MSAAAQIQRQRVELLLRQDIVREVEQFTGNLSETVEHLLQRFVAEQRSREAAKDPAKQARIDAAIDAHNAHYEQYGLVGEEFSPL